MTSFLYVVSYRHLSATVQTTSITVVNLQNNGTVVRIFIALLMFSVDFSSYLRMSVPGRDSNWAPLQTFFFLMFC